MNKHNRKTFLVINFSFFGDVLLTNVLCQNLKKFYPDSKLIFLANKPFDEAAKYQEGVDEVLVYDKRGENKGFFGLLKFVKSCKYYKKIDTSFVIYGNARGIMLSYLLGVKERISSKMRFVDLLLNNKFIDKDNFKHMQDINGNFIKALTGTKTEVLPIKYNAHPEQDAFVQHLKKELAGKELIGLCCVSKKKEKDMPLDTAVEIINLANNDNKTVLYLGAGKACRDYANELKKRGCINFVDLTDVTSISQLANILTICNSVISVDTGTLHLACAVGAPVVSVFYQKNMIEKWAPRDFLYRSIVVSDDYSAENIYKKALEISVHLGGLNQ